MELSLHNLVQVQVITCMSTADEHEALERHRVLKSAWLRQSVCITYILTQVHSCTNLKHKDLQYAVCGMCLHVCFFNVRMSVLVRVSVYYKASAPCDAGSSLESSGLLFTPCFAERSSGWIFLGTVVHSNFSHTFSSNFHSRLTATNPSAPPQNTFKLLQTKQEVLTTVFLFAVLESAQYSSDFEQLR